MSSGKRPQPLGQEALRAIVESTAGEAFFDEWVKQLARAIGTKCAWVAEWFEQQRRLRALSFWVGDGYYSDFEYDIADTPCEPVINNRRLIHVPDRPTHSAAKFTPAQKSFHRGRIQVQSQRRRRPRR